MHLSDLRLVGHLRVEGGELTLTGVSHEADSQHATRRKLGSSTSERALLILGGHVILMDTLMRGHAAGAIEVDGASLTLIRTIIQNCRAPHGGAMLVRGNASVIAIQAEFIGNVADTGGALQVIHQNGTFAHYGFRIHASRCLRRPQVDGGRVHMMNQTFFEHNQAPSGGSSIHLASSGPVEYTLPAPPGRWLNIRGGKFQLEAGSNEDLDFPYACRCAASCSFSCI